MIPSIHPVVDGLGRRDAKLIVAAPGEGPGFWAGGPSAIWHDGAVWLAYRLRRPVDAGRGYMNVVARSVDGYEFETVSEVTSVQFESASLERPALCVARDGTWRLFVSCATAGSKHWWIEMLTAPTPGSFGSGRGQIVLAGDESTAWKDPIVTVRSDEWSMWACRHDIHPPEHADRMSSWYLTSADGNAWKVHGPALMPTPGTWNQRGTRISAVIDPSQYTRFWIAIYDGRATAEQNWHELTGVATGTAPDHFQAGGQSPLDSTASIRYVSPVEMPDGGWLVYFEMEQGNGTHDLRVEYAPRPTGASQS